MAEVSDSTVDRVYEQIKDMAVRYELKPGERVNEGEVAKMLGVSRTPLREALNRLKIEGFLRFSSGRGFYSRDLDVREVLALYELRKTVETGSLKLAMERASDDDIDALLHFLDETGPDPGECTAIQQVELDEHFHEGLMAMSANLEMLRVLRNVNDRIRFVRWIDMDRINRSHTQIEHRNILLALKQRDERCVAMLECHIDRRHDQISSAIKEGYAKIYMPGADGY